MQTLFFLIPSTCLTLFLFLLFLFTHEHIRDTHTKRDYFYFADEEKRPLKKVILSKVHRNITIHTHTPNTQTLMSSTSNPRRWVSQRTQAALAVAATEGSPVTELAPAPQSNSVVETSTQSPLAPRHNSVVEPLPPPPPPPSAPSQHADLWTRLQLALNQLTTAQVDHFATNSATGATRPDFLLIPALYPLHTRHVAFQQRMLHYFVCFPLPRPAASSNKVFVSVFMDSYEALGGDAEFAFWFLLARLIPPSASTSAVSANQREGQHWTPTVSEMWSSLAFLRELEPSLLWPLCPSLEREAEYNALLSMDKPLIPAYREAAWLLLADLATRGAYSASVLFEAM
ncbi:transmembrane protein, putative, partial [Bodo saltans]